MSVFWDVLVMAALTIVFMLVLSGFANRILEVRIGVVRLVLAGLLGLGARVGFESQFVWGEQAYTPALLPVQIGIVFLVAIAFLVLAELLVPVGSIPRPDRWLPAPTLFQIFGYLLAVRSGLLTLRVLFDVFRIRRRDEHG
ncbi:hypothetical protein GCM10022240_26820 [Microbacterium kribbense]|uniref:Uncharacterized protein n=1 Tax=Microbacterium kribbense TaxID=433645 RepID=A0ABP7GSU9_9MICO